MQTEFEAEMAAIKQVDIHAVPASLQPASAPRAEIARLAALHREAEETALLANLLGRTPYAAAALAIAAGLAVAFAANTMPTAEIVTWLVLMLVGIGSIARAYSQAIAAPFERAALKAFSQDLTSMSVYLGFAWGAGAFLVLPVTGPLAAIAFAGGAAALFASLLRDRDSSLGFTAPVAALCALACVIRPLQGGALTAALVLIACGAVAGAVLLGQRLVRPSHLPDFQPG
jgi:hypothetical protein